MRAFGAPRIVGLAILSALVAAFVAYLVVNVPIHPKALPADQRFKHLLVFIDAIVIVAVVDAITIAAAVRRQKKEGAP